MNKELAKTLRQRILNNGGLVFVEKFYGMVQTAEKDEVSESGNPIRKRFPIATESVVNGQCQSHEELAIPNSALKGILYFEDNGTFADGRIRSGGQFQFTSNLRVVVWVNRHKVTSETYIEITGLAIADLIEKLEVDRNLKSEGMFNNLSVSVSRIPSQDAQIFSRYTYDEAVTQYLRPPFEFFAIDLSVKYSVNPSCMNEIILNESIC